MMRVDGAMVAWVGGSWVEVKSRVVGRVEASEPNRKRTAGTEPKTGTKRVVVTREVSSFSRLTDAESLGRLAMWETDRSGVTTARRVAAITDGAEWIQGFIDYHRPDAVRILDFPHAAQRVSDPFGDTGRGEGVGGGATDPAEGGGARAAFVRDGSGV